MKKILFVLPGYFIGGTTVSTLNLISLLDKEKYDVSVLPLSSLGELSELYKGFNILSTNILLSSISLSSWKLEPNLFKRLFVAFLRKLSHNETLKRLILNLGTLFLPSLKEFDSIIACEEGVTTLFVSTLVNKNKLAWVRCDYRRYLKLRNNEDEYSIYSKFNSIICVSDFTTSVFKKTYPSLSNAVYTLYNPQNSQLLINRGSIEEKDSLFTHDCFTIISVGRMDPIKRFHLIPRIAKVLSDCNIQFHWYVIGPLISNIYTNIDLSIKKFNLQNKVFFLGAKTNPHYFIKKSDLLVCLSESEACPRVINEAKILGTPTICTDFPSAHEFIESGVNGVITDINNMSSAIVDLYHNQNLYHLIKTNISKFQFNNTEALQLLHKLL